MHTGLDFFCGCQFSLTDGAGVTLVVCCLGVCAVPFCLRSFVHIAVHNMINMIAMFALFVATTNNMRVSALRL